MRDPKMRILYMGNNWLGWQVLRWLQEQGEKIVGLVLHPEEKRRYGSEMLMCARTLDVPIFDATSLREPETLSATEAIAPDIGLSILFGYILKPEFLSLFPKGVVNLHPAYLPYNRGAYPNVWSIVDRTPAGATLHYIDPGVDTGDIIARREVPVEPVDTGESLYHKLEVASLDLFMETWPLIRSGNAPRIPQVEEGTSHRVSDVRKIDQIELDREYSARELIDVIRARTYPPYAGAYFEVDGKRIYLRLQLLYEGQLEEGTDE